MAYCPACWKEFQSTLPLRGATALTAIDEAVKSVFQSTLPLRGATDVSARLDSIEKISIHTPLAGSDKHVRANAKRLPISIHTPLAGSDPTR